VANTLKLPREGAVGFIGWLDRWVVMATRPDVEMQKC
jgi:hypothetical protein